MTVIAMVQDLDCTKTKSQPLPFTWELFSHLITAFLGLVKKMLTAVDDLFAHRVP
jgi:hypothetical protein